jgi:hypothetical protein
MPRQNCLSYLISRKMLVKLSCIGETPSVTIQTDLSNYLKCESVKQDIVNYGKMTYDTKQG